MKRKNYLFYNFNLKFTTKLFQEYQKLFKFISLHFFGISIEEKFYQAKNIKFLKPKKKKRASK